ncbi:sensor histidine kinase [Clostridium paraputrificum]|uniref:sensor histidine kinase n=1 Tax=Clostridium TaxID=1485 RepID=UPI003D355890
MISNKDNFIKRRLRGIYNSRLFNPVRKYLEVLKIKIEKSIRFELMVVVAICFISAFMFYAFANDFMRQERRQANIVYNYQSIESEARNYVNQIANGGEGVTLKNDAFFRDMFNEQIYGGTKAYITDLDGNVIHKSSNVVEDKIDIFSVIASSTSKDYNNKEGVERKYVFPLNIAGDRCYFIYSDTPTARIEYDVYEVSNSFLALMLSCIVFIIIFIIITNKKMKYLDEIAVGLRTIANGQLDYQIEERGNDEIRNLASNINNMAKEINRKIVAERRAEKTKADLITNVSHDLRTPLTSIMGYIGLVKDGRYEGEETMREYLGIAFNKAEKLKVLIEDLFEYTKLNNNGIQINKTEVNLTEFIFQLTEELTPLFEDNGLSIIKSSAEEKMLVELDPDKMLRVFENLLTNAIKYSFKPGKIVIGVYESEGYATVAIRNKGNNIPQEKVAKLFERFYRLDESRNAQTGGSGLGLAISKNIVELHEGQIWAECYGEDISFYVKLKTSR